MQLLGRVPLSLVVLSRGRVDYGVWSLLFTECGKYAVGLWFVSISF